MTPGMKTSEFGMALAAMVIGLVLIIFGTLRGQQPLVELGTEMIKYAAVGFGLSRGLSKLGKPSEQVVPPADDKSAAATISGLK